MKLKRLHQDFPIFYCENFRVLTAHELEHTRNHVELYKVIDDTKGGRNFIVSNGTKTLTDHLGICNELFDQFINCLVDQFDAVISWDQTHPDCWAYCTNRHVEYYVWHNHLKSSTMHCVYYVNVPNTSGGEIDFELNGEFFSFKPKLHDFIIMPNYLNHAPRQPLSNEYRISLNMEAYCEQSPEQLIANFDNKSSAKKKSKK